MPLHLLGKKSWNVYNHDNIEKVKRDEAEAAAKEAAVEQRMQEVDAERRIRILRGLPVEELETPPPIVDSEPQKSSETYGDRDRKRRRRAGEDDTDRDIRYAKEAQSQTYQESSRGSHKQPSDITLHDTNGHINLFPEERHRKSASHDRGNPEVEQEKARKERELEDQYTMRFSNAAGFKDAVDRPRWYQGKFVADGGQEMPSKNVWREEDPRRKHREQIRMNADDPLAAIQQGVKGVRQAAKSRKDWKERQRHEIDDMVRQERKERKSRRVSAEELEGFSLDASTGEHDRDRDRRKHRHRHRDKDRSRSPRRHHRRHHHDLKER